MKRGLVMVAVLLASCTVGPNYLRPEVTLPDGYAETDAVGAWSDADLAIWWTSFNDPLLSSLIERALAQNLDIESAAARIREARALERVAGAGASPQLGAEASVTRQRISENAIPAPPGSGQASAAGFALPGEEFTTFRIGFDTGWELDLFGRTRRAIEAAHARTGAAIWTSRDVQGSIAAEVASAYLGLRALQGRVANAEAELARQQRFEKLVSARVSGGLEDGQQDAQQRSDRAAAAAAIPPLQAQARAEIHALGVLIGRSPQTVTADLSRPPALPSPPAVPAGLPSDLLRRRPDIRAAERDLAAATADVGVAVADLYPRFSLTATPALVSTALGSVIAWGSRGFAIGAAIDWPVFDGGRRRANVEVGNARQLLAWIAYRKAVLDALREVEDALTHIDAGQRQIAELDLATAAAMRAEVLAETRFRGGLVTYSDVLLARGRRIALEARMIETRGAIARDTVALAKALGGGWPQRGPQS